MNGPLDIRAPRRTAERPQPPPLPAAARRAIRPPPLETLPAPPPSAPPSFDEAETRPQPRVTREALKRIHSLLESINKIRAAKAAWEVAGGCANVIARTLDARGVIIHACDERARELRVIGVDGADAAELLGSVGHIDEDFIAMNVLASGRKMKVCVDGELPELTPKRLRALGTSRSIVAIPIMGARGCVAILEIVDVDERCESIISEVCELLGEQLVRVLAAPASKA
jgi:hypothetical protein